MRKSLSGHSSCPRKDSTTAGHPSGRGRRFAGLALLALAAAPTLIAMETTGCSLTHSRAPLDQSSAVKWLGKSRDDLIAALGQPTQAIGFPNTGGQMLIYAQPNQPHYVFETNGLGEISKAARVR